ncbi:MAG: HlyD family efflux transporter periplasmic adaptor subunit [Cyclobacteriaceae bacterium]|nr:HlyD family efflux transporter periplasmic adaptor subunit [Cyclobacteriaceae bacterium]
MAKKTKSNKVLYILLGLAVVLVIFAIVGKSSGWIGKAKETEVETDIAKPGRIVETVSASGMIQPVYEVKISPDVSGEIIELNVEEGDSVLQNQLLLKIRPDIYQSSLERAKANLNQQKANLADARARVARAEAQLIRAENEFNRNKGLKKDSVISAADFEISEANYKVAKNDLLSARESEKAAEFIVASAQATVKESEENLRFTIIRAPIAGIVSKLNVELGERVVGTAQMAGTEMLRIADLTKMEARVDVNENDIIRVSVGDTAEIDVDSYSHTGKKFKGVVTNIANTANDKTSPDAVTEFEVRIRILNSSYAELAENQESVSPFRPGMTTSVDITTEVKENILTIPLAAVTTRSASEKKAVENDKSGEERGEEQNATEEADTKGDTAEDEMEEVVFLYKDGIASLQEVKTGISDFENIEIQEGISDGDKIIKGPFIVVSKRLKDGDAVVEKSTGSEKKEEDK